MPSRKHLFALLILAGVSGPAAAEDAHTAAMAEEHRGDVPVASGAAEVEPAAPVDAGEVVYARLGERELRGYLARPGEGAAGAPGVILIHEWWGLNDNIRAMARRLAGEGYAALAVDLYGGEAASDAARARVLMQRAMEDTEAARENLRAAHGYLENELGAPRTGSIGWCFGGGWSLQTALMLPGALDATVMYYGRVETDPEQLRGLDTPVLGLFAGNDLAIRPEQVRAFETALSRLGKRAEIHIYEGADHAFANPSGTRYHVEAAEDAWGRTLAFFAETLSAPADGG